MKKLLVILLALVMLLAMTACNVQTANEDGTPTPAGVAITQGINLTFRLVEVVLWIAGAALAAALKKSDKLRAISAAADHVIKLASVTAGELETALVKDMREATADGKLTDEDITYLRHEMKVRTLAKLDAATVELLEAAGSDLAALIQGAADAWITEKKLREPLPCIIDGVELTDTAPAEPEKAATEE